MMLLGRWVLAILMVLVCMPHSALAADLAKAIEGARPSILAIGTFQRARSPAFRFAGTAFAVGNGDLVVTNAHVLPATLATDQFETLAVLLPDVGDGSPRIREVTRVAVDPDHDLAVLRVSGPPLPAMRLAGNTARRAGEVLLFTGYPIGNVLGAHPITHRAMISAVVPIAIPSGSAGQLDPKVIRRLSSGPFPVFQLDAVAYPGNSGSPLYDPESGEVVGVINMVLVRGTRESALSQPTGITYAIPVEHLQRLLGSAPPR
jgi:S1-C subfamily serine protease